MKNKLQLTNKQQHTKQNKQKQNIITTSNTLKQKKNEK